MGHRRHGWLWLAGAVLISLGALPARADDDLLVSQPLPLVPMEVLPDPANHCGRDRRVMLPPILETQKPIPNPVNPMFPPMSGISHLRILVDREGYARDVTVTRPGDQPALDKAAIAGVKNVWRWQPPPAACPDGVVLHQGLGWYITSPRVEILADDNSYPADLLARNQGGTGQVLVTISTSKIVLETKVAVSTGWPQMDETMLKIVAGFHLLPQRTDNHLYRKTSYNIRFDFLPDPALVRDVPGSAAAQGISGAGAN